MENRQHNPEMSPFFEWTQWFGRVPDMRCQQSGPDVFRARSRQGALWPIFQESGMSPGQPPWMFPHRDMVFLEHLLKAARCHTGDANRLPDRRVVLVTGERDGAVVGKLTAAFRHPWHQHGTCRLLSAVNLSFQSRGPFVTADSSPVLPGRSVPTGFPANRYALPRIPGWIRTVPVKHSPRPFHNPQWPP